MLERITIVGEAPSRSGARALHPDDCSSGRRLLEFTGWTRDEYLSCNLVNLFDEPVAKWDAQLARGRATRLRLSHCDLLVALGRRVERVLAGSPRRTREWFSDLGRGKFAIGWYVAPHPSGLNRWWNDEVNRRQARRFFNKLATAGWTP